LQWQPLALLRVDLSVWQP